MLHIETSAVYAAHHEEFGLEHRGLLHVYGHTASNNDTYHSVLGLQPYDFAVFGTELSLDGASDSQDWLVTDYLGGEATLVNSTPLLEAPELYTTPHLEKLVKRLGTIHASAFGIDALISYVYSKK